MLCLPLPAAEKVAVETTAAPHDLPGQGANVVPPAAALKNRTGSGPQRLALLLGKARCLRRSPVCHQRPGVAGIRATLAVALLSLSSLASAAVVEYTITSGNWLSLATWNASANGAVWTQTYDNGETPVCTGCDPDFPADDWIGALGQPGVMDGTYSGTLQIDTATNQVVGGSLIVTGSIAD